MAQSKEIVTMSSLRLQWRGALMVLAAWAALAAAQAQQPAPPASSVKSAPERFVTVTENGKTVRCRLVQSWQVQDGSTAHKLQAVESGEFITILDDPTATPPNGKGAAKRIYHWGLKNSTPPPGIPTPPLDTGIVLTVVPSHPQGSAIVQAGAVVGAPSSPYQVGAPNGPFGTIPAASRPVASAPIAGGPVVSTAMPCDSCTACTSGCNLCETPMTLRERIQSWFANRNATVIAAEPKVVSVVAVEPNVVVMPGATQAPSIPLPRSPVKTLAITEPPSSAQPARTEVVAAVNKNDIAGDWNRGAIGTTLPPPSKPIAEVAPPKPDVMTSPERFVPADRLKAKTVAQTVPDKQDISMPPGAASVLAARNGLDGPVVFVPVQTPVVPKPWRAPVPPDPKTPEAPQLNAYVNAFSPPAQPRGSDAPQVFGPGPQAMPYGPMMANGYPPQGMIPPYAMMNPYGMPQAVPYGYGYPVMQSGYPMQQQAPQTMGPRQYQGPMPPNPVGNNAAPMGVQPIGYMQPTMPYYQSGIVPVSAAQPAQPPTPQFAQFIEKLRDSPFPAEREQAAYRLTGFDWRANPQVAVALIRGASQDPAPMVRVGCVMTLTRMNIATDSVMGVLQNLRTDADPRVRDAADQAIVRLSQVRTAKAN
jgi:HEAT repeats